MVVTYFLPMLSMSVTYAKIGMELWGARAIGEATEVQRDSINSKRRVRRCIVVNLSYSLHVISLGGYTQSVLKGTNGILTSSVLFFFSMHF